MKTDESRRAGARQLRVDWIYFFAFCILQQAPLVQQDPPLQQSPANALTAKVKIKARPIRADVSRFISILLIRFVFIAVLVNALLATRVCASPEHMKNRRGIRSEELG